MNLIPSLPSIMPLAALGVAAAYGWQLQSAQTVRQPFSATSVEQRIEPDGTTKYRFEKTTYTRSDGSQATEETRYYESQGKPVALPFRVIEDVRTERLTSVYPQVNAKMSSRLTPGRLSSLSAAQPADCSRAGSVSVPGAAPIIVSGFRAVLRARTTEANSGLGQPAAEDREWVIPELGCFVAKYERRWRDEKGQYLPGYVSRETSRIELGEPPVAAFAVPEGLNERSPSQVMTAQNAVQGRTCTECDRKAMENGDRAYFRQQ